MNSIGQQISRGRAAYAAIAQGPKTTYEVADAMEKAGVCQGVIALYAARTVLQRLAGKQRIRSENGKWRVNA